MLVSRASFLYILGLVSSSIAQSSTSASSSTSPASGSSSSPTSRPSTRSPGGTQTVNGTTTFPTNGTITLSANGTATATIVNGTAVNATTTPTPTSTSPTAFPTLAGVSACVVQCLQSSVSQANCSSVTDVACFCSNATFRNATVNCVSTQCPSELQGAESLAQQFCSLESITLTFPSPTFLSITPTPTPTNGVAQELRHPVALATFCGLMVWVVLGS